MSELTILVIAITLAIREISHLFLICELRKANTKKTTSYANKIAKQILKSLGE